MMNCEICKTRPATVLKYCSSCWERHDPSDEELEIVINQQLSQLPRWWEKEQELERVNNGYDPRAGD